jgi:hypothetical protein
MKNLNALLSFIMALFPFYANADNQKSQSFVVDPNIQKIAEAYALDAVDLAKIQFNIKLDWSDGSIENVEKALVKMHASYAATTPRPTQEQVMSFAKAFGSYVGEVYRRNHGGKWGIISLNEQKFPGLRTNAGANFWPWARVANRITDGDENNVFDYYQVLLQK